VIAGKLIAIALIAYLLGAIPFGLILGKLIARIDISKHGSGNIGGTNVLRTVGTEAAIGVVVLDVGKAVLAVTLAKLLMGDDVFPIINFPIDWRIAQILAGLMVMAGHNWSIYIKFRGGKGVATYFGSLLPMSPAAALFGGILCILIATFTRYVSLGSILGSLAAMCMLIALILIYEFSPVYLIYSIIGIIMIAYQHRSNISRLQNRTERRLGDKENVAKIASTTDDKVI
jgi:glycerol-3-phosphate acyltransferase PlsY